MFWKKIRFSPLCYRRIFDSTQKVIVIPITATKHHSSYESRAILLAFQDKHNEKHVYCIFVVYKKRYSIESNCYAIEKEARQIFNLFFWNPAYKARLLFCFHNTIVWITNVFFTLSWEKFFSTYCWSKQNNHLWIHIVINPRRWYIFQLILQIVKL